MDNIISPQKDFYSSKLAKILLILFFIISLLDLISVNGAIWPRIFTKPGIMSTLIIYYLVCSPVRDKLFISALIMALLGDLLLIKGDEFKYFILGLVSFLVMQALYIIRFNKDLGKINKRKWSAVMGIAVFTIFFITIIMAYVESSMIAPVVIYGLSIGAMGISSITRHSFRQSYNMVVIGAILFIISDSCLAYGKFINAFPKSGLWIMSTYILAQFFIVRGILIAEHHTFKFQVKL